MRQQVPPRPTSSGSRAGLGTVGRAVTVVQKLDSPLRAYQMVVPPTHVEGGDGARGPQVLDVVPDDISWAVPPPASTSGGASSRRLLRRNGSGGLLARSLRRDALALADACSEALLAVDRANRIVVVNAAAQRLFGYRSDDMIGRSADILVTPAVRGVLALLRQQVLQGDGCGPRREAVEVAAVRRDGSGFPATVRLARVQLRRGTVVTVAIRDLSSQRAADARAQGLAIHVQQSRDAVGAVLRAISDRAIVIADAEGRITDVNRAAERLLGYSMAELVGLPTLRLYDPDDIAVAAAELGLESGIDPLLEITRSGLPNLQEWAYLAKDGRRCPVSLKITAVGNRRNPSGFVCVAHDLTLGWQPAATAAAGAERLLLELDDAPTRALRWQVGGSGYARRR